MGALAAIAAVITTARLNSGTHSIGQMAELCDDRGHGDRHLAGRRRRLDPGRHRRALLIQTLDNGMVLMDVSSPKRQISIGLILIAAVWFDVVTTRGRANERHLKRWSTCRGLSKNFNPRGRERQLQPLPRRWWACWATTAPARVTLIKGAVGRVPGRRRQDSCTARAPLRDARERMPPIETSTRRSRWRENLDAPSNLFLGRLLTPWRMLDADRIETRERAGDPAPEPGTGAACKPVRSMSGGQRQTVAIAARSLLNAAS